LNNFATFGSVLGLLVAVIFGSVLGLLVNSELQPQTRLEPFLADTRDDHYPVCGLDIQQDSDFATGYRYPKIVLKREPDTDPDIRNAFIDISRIQTFGKSCTLHNHSFTIFKTIFSAFCALTPSLSVV